jgi:hypothetical protein
MGAVDLPCNRIALTASGDAISRIESLFNSQLTDISDRLNMMPKQLGWVWEGGSGPLDAPVQLFDAFGNAERLPLIFLSSTKVKAFLTFLQSLL